MNYSQMIATLIGMSEPERRQTIRQNWQLVFDDGFANYVQNQIEQIDEYVGGERRGLSQLLPDMMHKFMVGANKLYKIQVVAVWDSMQAVYAQGPAAYAGVTHETQETEYDLTGQIQSSCSRCGSPTQANGLCGGCFDHDEFIERDHINYDNQLYDQQLEQQQYQHIQDDYSYYDTQMDYSNEY